jgi:hypothetical protein
MAARIEQFLTGVTGSLDATINDTVTTMAIDSATGWPAAGDFRVVIEAETLLVTGVSGVTWTVVRGVDGTTAAAHAGGATVTGMLTKGSLDQIMRDVDPGYLTRDPYRIQDANGDPLTHSDFTEVNFATNNAVASTNDGNIRIAKDDHVADDLSMLVIAAPSTPYTITGAFTNNAYGDAGSVGPEFGLVFYESGTGKIMVCEICATSTAGYRVTKYNSTTSWSSHVFSEPAAEHQPLWMKIEDDGTNLKFYHSMSGFDFDDVYRSELRGAFFTTGPDQVGFVLNNIAGLDGGHVDLVAWNER